MKKFSNPKVRIPSEVLRRIDEHRAARHAEHKAVQGVMPGMARELRGLRGKISEVMNIDIGAVDREVAIINKAARDRLVPVPDVAIIQRPKPPPPPPPADDHFWWIQTTAYGARGITHSFDDEGVRFHGQSPYDGDQLLKFSVGATADFVIQASRLPPSTIGRWSSSPAIVLAGYIVGFTGLQFILSLGDKWCKCWLHLNHEIFQVPPATFAHLGERHSVIELMNEENNFDTVTRQMPGFIDLPRLDFSLADPNADVFAQIDVRFDIQLEGMSNIIFGRQPFDQFYVSLRHYQWPAAKL